MPRLATFASALALACTGCSGTKRGASECTSITDCQGGFICTQGTCQKLCTANGHCPSGQRCDANLCKADTRENIPVISSIDGNGTEDPAGDEHAAHRFVDAIVLGGEHLGTATIDMWDDTHNMRRLEASGSDTELTAKLPAHLKEGIYAIRAVNDYGADRVVVSILRGEQGPPGGAGLVTETTTLNVGPSDDYDYHDINQALDSLNQMLIPPDVTVTIRVADNETPYTYETPVVIDHPNGDRIRIIGNEAEKAKVVLAFGDCHGFLVNGTKLGWLNGFRIVGSPQAKGKHGIYLEDGAVVHAGEALETSSWGGSGVVAANGSVFRGAGMVSTNNGENGYFATDRGTLRVDRSESTGNGRSGYLALRGSTLNAEASTAQGNLYGGFSAEVGSTLWAAGSSAESNGKCGFCAFRQSVVDAGMLDNTGALAAYNDGPGFHVEEGSTVFADDSIARDNQYSGYFAYMNATLSASRGQAVENHAHGFDCQWGSTCWAYDAVAKGNGTVEGDHGFLAYQNSALRGDGAEARDNKGSGFLAVGGSVIYARGIGADNPTVACGNGVDGFFPAIGNTNYEDSASGSVIDVGGNVDDVDDQETCP